MNSLMLLSDAGASMGAGAIMFIVLGVFAAFLAGVFFVRWVFGIDKILNALKQQNEQSALQIELLKKMLHHHGVSNNEIDAIMEKGNKRRGLF